MANFTLDETKRALKQMGSWKAQGPDGFHAGFFKRTWDITRAVVHNFVQGVIKGEEILHEAAEVILVLVSKVTKPISIKSFRPNALCYVSVKLVN